MAIRYAALAAIVNLVVNLLVIVPSYGESISRGDLSGFSNLLYPSIQPSFLHLSASVPAVPFNDEGDPYRLSLGVGHSVAPFDLTLLTNLVYSYYGVNAVADNNPSTDIEGGSSHSLGIDIALRKSFTTSEGFDYYYEGGGGFQSMLTNPPFPADGSDENFTLFFGPGIVIPAGDNKRVSASLQWFHISNANLFPDNSGYDGLQLLIGVEWPL